jgi:hypothetical protein
VPDGATWGNTPQPPSGSRASSSAERPPQARSQVPAVSSRRRVNPSQRNAMGTIGQRRLDRTGDGDASRPSKTVRMRPAGFLSERQRRFAWVGFLLAALQAPAAALLIDDASWLFSVCVALLVATVILADDNARRRQVHARE